MLVILDSNPLHGRADPEQASELRSVLALASQAGAKIAIPEACRIELREGIREKIRKLITDVEKVQREFQRLKVQCEFPKINEATQVNAYVGTLNRFLEKHNIRPIPFPNHKQNLEHLFELAAKKQPPFDPQGNSFRDAVICLSVEEYIQGLSEPILFVTGDGSFTRSIRARGIETVTAAKAREKLEKTLSEKDRQRRTQMRESITNFLQPRLGKISRFAEENTDFTIAKRLGLGVQLVGIDEFAASGLNRVELGECSENDVAFTAEVTGKLVCTVRGTPYVPPKIDSPQVPTRVGQSFPELPAYIVSAESSCLESQSPSQRESFPTTLAVDGKAKLDAALIVEKVDYVSVQDKSQMVFGLLIERVSEPRS